MRVAAVQMNSGADVDANIARALELVDDAAAAGANLVLLPENVVYYGRMDAGHQHVEPVDGPATRAFTDATRRAGIWLHCGSFHIEGPDGKPRNRTIVVNPDGDIVATYDKVHLFDVELADGIHRRESDYLGAGTELVCADVNDWRVGLTVCYDLRFPEMYQPLTAAGAELLVIPAAFTSLTGPPHWEVLLRARAIENQCYVLASAQYGPATGHDGATKYTHGHSMLVDPWGTVLDVVEDGDGFVLGDIDRSVVANTRAIVPSIETRQSDVYTTTVRTSNP